MALLSSAFWEKLDTWFIGGIFSLCAPERGEGHDPFVLRSQDPLCLLRQVNQGGWACCWVLLKSPGSEAHGLCPALLVSGRGSQAVRRAGDLGSLTAGAAVAFGCSLSLMRLVIEP